MRVLIAGGGTGGHLYPALALVPAAGFDLATVNVRGLDRDAVWKNAALPAIVPAALRAGLRIVDGFKPDVVLGMGGYVMAPAVAAARMRGIPYVLHEKDVRPGLATRFFARGAAAICTTLPGTERRVRNARVELTGVPLRDGFEPRTAAVPPRHLLVTGGSQGARHINEAVWGALDELRKRFEEVVHVAGPQGAVCVGDAELSPATLVATLDSLNADRLRAMAKASAGAGRRDAAQRVLAVLREVART